MTLKKKKEFKVLRFRDLAILLNKPGCKHIEIDVKDTIPFLQYWKRSKFKELLIVDTMQMKGKAVIKVNKEHIPVKS